MMNQHNTAAAFMILLTRDAVALRVTMMIGQIGRYLERSRAEEPLLQSVFKKDHKSNRMDCHLVVSTRMAPALSSILELTADVAVAST